MKSKEIKEKFLAFFKSKGHRIMPKVSLVSHDLTTLFTTAGMQQFKQYYIYPEKAPAPRVVTIQPCLRTKDLEEVGDESHLTFFEMLGNFSFGDYFKEEAILWAWEFLTKELGIEENRISATYFKGKKGLPADKESLAILKEIKGLSKIKGAGFEDNFWSLGLEGSPGGPTVEFYTDGIEIWNLVFNEYIFNNETYQPSRFKGVDTGMGLERLAAVLQNKEDVFETDLFWPIIKEIETISGKKYQTNKKEFRIIADHIKAAVFAILDGVLPSNKEAGYVVRRLIRRAIVRMQRLGFSGQFTAQLGGIVFKIKGDRPNRYVLVVLEGEESKFQKVFKTGQKLITQSKSLSSGQLFDLYQTHGFPLELTLEIAKEKGVRVSQSAIEGFNKELTRHRKISRAGVGMFKGGLATTGEAETKLHTATHLLHAALRQVLGNHVMQKGSNITAERLRFDFSHPAKMSPEEIKKVEDLVNEQIKQNLPVTMQEMSLDQAKQAGALGFFESRYGDRVRVYSIGHFSKEICGGPHVRSTGELGYFKIIKEESSSAGTRRIKAILNEIRK